MKASNCEEKGVGMSLDSATNLIRPCRLAENVPCSMQMSKSNC